MVTCDRCDVEILVSTDDISVGSELTEEQLKSFHEPDDDPFTLLEGLFAAWTSELNIDSRGRFSLFLCRDCTETFVEWIDDPDVCPSEDESYDHSIEWSHVEDP